MKIQILSERKKHHGLNEYTKSQFKEVPCFFYDEDCFWFDYGGNRFGLPYLEIVKLRKNSLRSLDRDIKKMRRKK